MGDGQTERLEAAEAEVSRLRALLAHRARVRDEVLEGALTGWWGWQVGDDRAGYLSPAFKARLGYADDELPSSVEGLERVHPPGTTERLRAAFAAHAATGVPFDITLPFYHRDGSVLWVQCRGRIIDWHADGQPKRIVGGYVDLTRFLRSEEEARSHLAQQADQLVRVNEELATRAAQLERSNAALEDFAYAASHDLQAPLRAVANFAAWIAEELPPEAAEVHGHVDRLLDRVDRLRLLHRDLLAYARAGQAVAEVVEVKLAAVVANAWRHDAAASLVIERLPDRPLRLAAAPLLAVLRALMDNAVQHHGEGRATVTVRAVAQPGRVVLTVADDGPGVEPRYHERIFGVLETLRSRDAGAGSGMGLPIARKYAEAAGGQIAVLPQGPPGAAFQVTWPAEVGP
ncbi:MAG: PAS domain-containing protein [Myxococcales bacterium]|nr:PAS domain-containing protein [Myxococcales bacterium]MCB9547469.1 PAS domain-containing protein [Myxococcales bacterium]